MLIENNIEVYRSEIDFTIQGLPDMNMEILLCKDPSYKERSLVFIRARTSTYNYTSDPPDPAITATLTFPDNSESPLTPPST